MWPFNKRKAKARKKIIETIKKDSDNIIKILDDKYYFTELDKVKKNNKDNKEKLIVAENFIKFQDAVKKYDITRKKSWHDMRYYINKIIKRFFPISPFLAKIDLRNGDTMQLIVDATRPFFVFSNGTYLIDKSKARFDINSKLWSCTYSEDISIPLEFNVNPSKIKSTLYNSDQIDIDMSIDPAVLKQFIESDFVQKVMKGADLSRDLGFLKMMILLNVVMSGLGLILMIKASGII